jgi:hypothetical protein
MELMVFQGFWNSLDTKIENFFDLKTNPQKIGTSVCLIDLKHLENQTNIY